MTGDVLQALAAHGLPSHHQLPDHPMPDHQWAALIPDVERHRLMGLFASAVASGALPVDDAQHAHAAERDEAWQAQALKLDQLLVKVSRHLGACGIDHRVMKGSAAALLYPKSAERVMGDIDLVVPSSQFGAARQAMAALVGTDHAFPELRPGFDRRFAKEATFRLDSHEVDLHRTLVAGPFGLSLDTADLFTQPTTFALAGHQLTTFQPAVTVLQLCFNAALGDIPARLQSVRDLAQALRVLQPGPDEVIDLASRWQALPVLHRGLQLVSTELRPAYPEPLLDWAAQWSPGRKERFLLDASISRNRSYTRQLAALAVIPGVGQRARYVWAIANPQRSYLEARGWTRTRHLRRAATKMARLPRSLP